MHGQYRELFCTALQASFKPDLNMGYRLPIVPHCVAVLRRCIGRYLAVPHSSIENQLKLTSLVYRVELRSGFWGVDHQVKRHPNKWSLLCYLAPIPLNSVIVHSGTCTLGSFRSLHLPSKDTVHLKASAANGTMTSSMHYTAAAAAQAAG